MRIALCNEVLGDMPLERQCEYAAALGYDGLEIAPFTLSNSPEKISTADAAKIRSTVEASGLVVTGLHWLLVKPDGLSLTDPDAAVRTRTLEVMMHLIGLCAELGGAVLVHGSPKQRQITPGETHGVALARLQDALAQVALAAARERSKARPGPCLARPRRTKDSARSSRCSTRTRRRFMPTSTGPRPSCSASRLLGFLKLCRSIWDRATSMTLISWGGRTR